MTKFSRLALALPLCAAMAAPAAASQFFSFSTTLSHGGIDYTLAGTTVDASGTSFSLDGGVSSLMFTVSGGSNAGTFDLLGSNLLYEGDVLTRTLGQPAYDWRLTSVNISGSSWGFSGASPVQNTLYWSLAPWEGAVSPQAFFALSPGFFYVGDNPAGTSPNLIPSTQDANSTQFSRSDTPSAALVPEINGSGFAYIAFILGALGLWLYSGAGRGRQEETPAVA